jgi:flagellar motility protein MotE (MotC chaperone)
MRYVRAVVLASLVVKVTALSLWWWSGAAWAERPQGPAAGAPPPAAVPPDVLAGSRGFRELLEGVRKRATELDEREQATIAREAALASLQKALAEQAARLEALGKAAGAAGGLVTGAAMTKIYEGMKAEEAAPILDKLDDATVKAILRPMKEKQIGAILAAMNRERAVVVTKLLAGR